MDIPLSKHFLTQRLTQTDHCSVGTYKDNEVTIEWSMTSTAAGSLDASSALNVVSDNFNMYNISKPTYRLVAFICATC